MALGDHSAYCLAAEATANCVVLLSDSLGAFGTQASLRAIFDARDGKAPNLASKSDFVKIVDEAGASSPIWGVATGPAVVDWFKGWMPNQSDLKLDWAAAFKPVQALIYRIDPGDTIRVNARMDCATSQDATGLSQVFQGLRLFQQIAWQQQNPGRPNPFQNLEVQASDRRVLVDLSTPYTALQPAG